ncbi:MAG TPA: hypothetical protein VGF67_23755 [Ktedonobacteraceae bacterium]
MSIKGQACMGSAGQRFADAEPADIARFSEHLARRGTWQGREAIDAAGQQRAQHQQLSIYSLAGSRNYGRKA